MLIDNESAKFARISRYVETLVIRKLDHGIPYPFDSTIPSRWMRKSDLKFDSIDWRVYLMLMHLKNRVRFGDDDLSLHAEKQALKQVAEYLHISFDQCRVFHTDLITKMNWRKAYTLSEVPDIPISAREQHKALVKRIEVQELAYAVS